MTNPEGARGTVLLAPFQGARRTVPLAPWPPLGSFCSAVVFF